MKFKYADFPNWSRVNKKSYINKYFNNDEFSGNISLLTAEEVKEKLFINKHNEKIVLLDNKYKYLEIYPENNKNIAVSVAMDNNDKILEWYFDIAKDTLVTEQGVPYIKDLYLDVVLYPSGKIEILDEDELQEALNNKDITKEEFDFAYNVSNKLIQQIDGKVKEIQDFTNRYYELLKK